MVLYSIETHPTDRKVCLYHPDWLAYPIALWDWVEGPDDEGNGGFCLWHIQEGGWITSMDDGLLWPEEDVMPTHWFEIPEVSINDPLTEE